MPWQSWQDIRNFSKYPKYPSQCRKTVPIKTWPKLKLQQKKPLKVNHPFKSTHKHKKRCNPARLVTEKNGLWLALLLHPLASRTRPLSSHMANNTRSTHCPITLLPKPPGLRSGPQSYGDASTERLSVVTDTVTEQRLSVVTDTVTEQRLSVVTDSHRAAAQCGHGHSHRGQFYISWLNCRNWHFFPPQEVLELLDFSQELSDRDCNSQTGAAMTRAAFMQHCRIAS